MLKTTPRASTSWKRTSNGQLNASGWTTSSGTCRSSRGDRRRATPVGSNGTSGGGDQAGDALDVVGHREAVESAQRVQPVAQVGEGPHVPGQGGRVAGY